ncbi:ABC transporter substrate-binding protein [Oscillatoria sp. CS-180]|uniref:ABC transporter substrate-binding protein n=1 Tax=Oscillatoria sp. CS-180 TaxID=3021720 RepID=UPI00232C7C7C|nr:ABC transporter substrate-binding protein [Oscillatoria sp. CS-180]MDB9525362.1 ABC transporter substrate-binding protein [Oscillatoria sp. CS-180]
MGRVKQVALGIMVLAIAACGSNSSDIVVEPTLPRTLRIFWNQGFYPEEDLALQQLIEAWEVESGIEVELTLYSSDDILNQATVALENDNPPDVLFAHRADYTLQPQWAWEGKLVDVSDVLEPYLDDYTPAALEAAYLYDETKGDRSYYGVPIEQQTLHLHYWRSLLQAAELDEDQIPQDWQGFWDFWQQAQATLRQLDNPDIYGLGLTLSTQGSDTYYFFEQVMDAYDVELFDQEGEFQGDDPAVRAQLIEVLDWTTQFYVNDYVPKDAVNWLDVDNNVQFLNQATLMTPNPSLSIPASQREDDALYTEQIATRVFPNEPDGEPITYVVTIKQALIFSESSNIEAAKDFLSYLLEPDRLNTYVKGSLGRWFPAMESSLQDPFWSDPADPHVAIAVQQFTQSPTRPLYHAVNPAYSQVQAENIWGQAIGHVAIDGWSSEAAVDEAIAQIQEILAQWDDSSP